MPVKDAVKKKTKYKLEVGKKNWNSILKELFP